MNIHRVRFADFTPHTVTALSFSHSSTVGKTPRDLRLAIGRNNGDIEIWNPKYGWIHEQTLKGGKGRTIEGLAWAINDDDKVPRLFSIGGSSILTEWNLKTGLPLKNYDCNAGIIWCLKVNQANDKIAVGCDNGSVVLIDISGGLGSLEHDIILQRQSSRVLSIDFNQNLQVFGGCADAKIRCWSIDKSNKSATRGRLMGTMKVDKSVNRESTLIWTIKVLPKRNQLVSGDSTGSLKIWDLKYLTLLQSLDSHKADILCLSCDLKEEKLFSAGIDRKIINFNFIQDKWVNACNKVSHANDIRSIASYESKTLNLLVSGGVDKSIIINSVKFFNNNKIQKKLPIALQYQNNIIQHASQRLIIMWQDQQIKIWKIFKNDTSINNSNLNLINKNYKLVSKMNLNEDSNISYVSISGDGELLAVGYLSSIKLFKLDYNEVNQKMKIFKLKDLSEKLEAYGGKILRFDNANNLYFVNEGDELVKFDFKNQTFQTFGFEDNINSKSKLSYTNSIKDFKISSNGKIIAVSRYFGVLDLLYLKSNDEYLVKNLIQDSSSLILSFEFTRGDSSILILNNEHRLYEFFTCENKLVLTEWSKLNSEKIPTIFQNLKNKCIGMFVDMKNKDKIWLWGCNWISFINLNTNLPKSDISKKRKLDMLTSYNSDGDQEENNIEQDAKTSNEFDNLKESQVTITDSNSKIALWLSKKYELLLNFGNFNNNDLYVIERTAESFPHGAAFKTNQISF